MRDINKVVDDVIMIWEANNNCQDGTFRYRLEAIKNSAKVSVPETAPLHWGDLAQAVANMIGAPQESWKKKIWDVLLDVNKEAV